MKISVIIPCRNAGATLAQALTTLQLQTFTPLEIIVVDDGSTDDSIEQVHRFGSMVRLLASPGAGANAARNAGARAAAGEALMFMDADDLLGPNVLEQLAAVLREEPAGVAACAWRRLTFAHGAWLSGPPSCARRGAGEHPIEAWLSGWHHPPCSVLWSRPAFELCGGWDPAIRINQDGELMIRALARGAPLRLTEAALAYYRRAPTGSSISTRAPDREKLQSQLATLAKIADVLNGRYGAALSRAFDRLGERCRRFPDLCRDCRQAMRIYGGPPSLRRIRDLARQADVGAGQLRRWLAAAAGAPALQAPQAAWNANRSSKAPPPLVSVVLPSFNRAGTLGRAIHSVLTQTYGRFELLVVDDGSTDATESIVKGFADARVRYLRQDGNQGVAAARNRGMREALGELIAFLDSDDAWTPRKLERQVALLRSAPAQVGLVYCGVEVRDASGVRSINLPAQRGYLFRTLLAGNVVHGCSGVVMRRTVFDLIGGFDETLTAIEDYDYWLRAAQFFAFDYVEEPLLVYDDRSSDAEALARRRRSLNFQANTKAREALYSRYRHDMRAAGTEAAFLFSTVRRQLNSPEGSVRTARRAALRALIARPLQSEAWAWLALTSLPGRARARLRQTAAKLRSRQVPRRLAAVLVENARWAVLQRR